MKRFLKAILIIAIVCVLALTLTACGEKDNETKAQNKTNTAENEVNETEGVENKGRETVPDNTEEAKAFTRGKWEDNKYVNDYIK